jgi:hypothetical protein
MPFPTSPPGDTRLGREDEASLAAQRAGANGALIQIFGAGTLEELDKSVAAAKRFRW